MGFLPIAGLSNTWYKSRCIFCFRVVVCSGLSRVFMNCAAFFRSGFLSFLALCFSAGASGAVLTVTSLADKNSPGTLRSALKSAVCGDVIEFSERLFRNGPGTIQLSNGLAINTAVSIVGPGADLLTIDGRGQYQVFSITTNCQTTDGCGTGTGSIAAVTLSGLTIRGGVSSGGGGVLVSKNSCVNLIACRLVGNETKSNGGSSAFGGGIYNRGIVVLDLCTFEGNLAGLASVPGNPGGAGGGLYNAGDAVVTRSLFVGNQAAFGGGLTNGGGTLIVESSTFSGNGDQAAAGGLFLDGGVTELTNLTVFENSSLLGNGGLRVANGGQVEVRNSILAVNSGQDAGAVTGGSFISLGFNLFSGAPVFADSEDDLVNADPMLGPLAANGGASLTHALGAGSPALNAGDPVFAGFLHSTDQRGEGFPRSSGVAVDLGAYEEASTRPTIECPPDRTAECVGSAATVTVTVRVGDADGDRLTVTWSIAGIVVQTDTDVNAGSQVELTRAFPEGLTLIEVEVSDGRYTESCSTSVKVIDRMPPFITLLGANPLLVECGNLFQDPGATAFDTCEGTVTVEVTGTVDTSTLGEVTLTYAAADSSGNASSRTRTVRVVDTTAPVLSASGPLERDAGPDCSYLFPLNDLSASAADGCDDNPLVTYWLETASGDLALTGDSVGLEAGVHTLRIEAEDASGNVATPVTVTVTIKDVLPPVVTLVGKAQMVISCEDDFIDPGATATDGCDGLFPATSSGLTVEGIAGSYEVTYTAVDAAGNAATPVTRTVIVRPSVVLTPPADLIVETDPGFCLTRLDLAELVGVTGSCLSDAALKVTILLPDGSTDTLNSLTAYDFPKGTSEVVVEAFFALAGEEPIATGTPFSVTVEDTFLNCAGNIAWPVALDLEFNQLQTLSGGQPLQAILEQFLAGQGERRWVRIRNTPAGSRLTVALSNPAGVNYDLTVYRDIQEAYDELLSLLESDGNQVSAILGTQFSPEAFAPDAFAPDAFAPDAFAPDAFAPDAFAPDAFAPDAFAPDAFAPDAFAPDAFAPDAFAPDAFAPDAFAPDAFAPDAFAAAQNRVLASFSAFDGPTDGVRVTNFEESTDYYIRISGRNGAFSTASPFTLFVEVETEICDGVEATLFVDGEWLTTASEPVLPASNPETSLILWDSRRMAGYASSTNEQAALADALARLAAAVNGVLVDVSTKANVNAFNAQADQEPNTNCPYAKNLVAEAIRNIVNAYRKAYPLIGDITIVGNDDVIPFFRRSDDANLANEAQYFPPVLNSTHSQSALRTGRVLEQDSYGSDCRVILSTGEYNLPGLPVGRLVETAAEVIDTVNTYLPVFSGPNPGVLPSPSPSEFKALSVAYDFMADAGQAIADEFTKAAGLPSSTLIAASDLAPAESWTAADLSAAFFEQDRLDLVFLGAHFSTASGLAADYVTRFTAAQLEVSPVDLTYAIIASQGCHSGYNTVNPHAIESITLQPDWAQGFARKKSIFLAGTGYQYGETQLLEYGERLYLEFARQLRTGTGPVSVGEAMVRAKLTYLAQTPNMRGIHEKTLLVGLTLYGLPMVKVDLPGERLPAAEGSTGGLPTVDLGGDFDPETADFGLETADLPVIPSLTKETLLLDVVGQDRTVEASYYVGNDGAVSLVAEPIRPLESAVVNAASGALLRGVVLRSATYVDETPFLPLTGAPATEIRGVAAPFKSEVFYPIIPWATNQIGELCGDFSGGSVLNTFPAQFRSDPIDPLAEAGTLRKYTGITFGLYYSGNTTSQALTPAPAVNGVAAELSPDGSQIVIEAVIETAATVGIEEVLATFTGESGSIWHGSWKSVPLTPTATPLFFPGSLNGDGFVRTWTASIPLNGGDPSGFRFIVQTVGRNGPALQATNFGKYFRVGGDPATGDTATSVAILTTKAAGAYGSTVLVEAEVKSAGSPVPDGERVDFRLGPVARSALTVGGVATAELTLYAAPRDYILEASYRGSSVFAPSSAQQPFDVVKQDTTLSFDAVSGFSRPSDWFVLLRTDEVRPKPLKEKTVVFVITNMETNESFFVSEITDGAGRAAPGALTLPIGTYAVAAYFATESIPGTKVSLVDPLYNASDAVGVFKVAVEVAFSARSARVTYNDTTLVGLTDGDRGLSVARLSGGIELADPTVDPADLLGDPAAGSVMATLLVRLSGEELVNTDIPLSVASGGSGSWKGAFSSAGTTTSLELIWSGSAFFDSALTQSGGPRIRSLFIGSGSTDLELTTAKGNYTVTFTGGSRTVTVDVQGGRVSGLSGVDPDDYAISSSGQVVVFTVPYAIANGQVIGLSARYSDITVTTGANLFPVSGSFNVVIDRAAGAGPAYSATPAVLEATLAVGTANGETPAAGSVRVGDDQTPWTEEEGPVYRKLTPGGS